MKILITGGCGFVGSNIAVFLKKNLKSVKIFSVDNLMRKGSDINCKRLQKLNIKNFKINIENFDLLKKLPKFNLIIDCCAEPAIEQSTKNPDKVFNTNLVGTYNILKKCLSDKANLIFLSSSRVYSIQALRKLVRGNFLSKTLTCKKKINENFQTSSPISLYGFTKLSSENLIKEIFYSTKLKYIINRFGVISGPWQFGKQDQGFVSLWIAKHLLKRKLSYIGFGGKGNQVRDIIHIEDVCEIILIQMKKMKNIYNQTFNIGGGIKNMISLKSLTKKCQLLTSNNIQISSIKKTSKFDIPYYVSDNQKIYKFYKWLPSKNISQIIQDVYNWLINNKMLLKYFK